MEIKKCGRFNIEKDRLDYFGNSFDARRGNWYGIKLHIKSKKRQKVHFILYSKSPIDDGFSKTELSIETNGTYTLHSKIPDSVPEGIYQQRVEFPDHDELETIEQRFCIFRNGRGVLFSGRANPGASEREVAALETKYDIALPTEYRQFLLKQNGLNLAWWFDLLKHYEPEVLDALSFLDNERESTEWLLGVRYIFSLGLHVEYMDLETEVSRLPSEFVKLAFPIGEDVGGNTLFLLLAGEHKDKLAMADHETFRTWPEELLKVKEGQYDPNGLYALHDNEEKLGFQDFASASVDQIFDEAFSNGFLQHYPIEFAAYLQKLVDCHVLIRTRLIENLQKRDAASNRVYQWEVYAKGFAPHQPPALLKSLWQFEQETTETRLRYSGCFCLQSNLGDSFFADVFNSTFLPFAKANGSGSVYGFWVMGEDTPLDEVPINIFGDEGGLMIVAENLKELLRNLAFEGEPHLYERDNKVEIEFSEQEVESPAHYRYLQWLERQNVTPTQCNAESSRLRVLELQQKYEHDFLEWQKAHNAFYQPEDETAVAQGQTAISKFYFDCFMKGIEEQYPKPLGWLRNYRDILTVFEAPNASKALIFADMERIEGAGRQEIVGVVCRSGGNVNAQEIQWAYQHDCHGSGIRMRGLFKSIYYLRFKSREPGLTSITAVRLGQEIALPVIDGEVTMIDWSNPGPVERYTALHFDNGETKEPAIPYTPYSAEFLIQSQEKYWADMDDPDVQWVSDIDDPFMWREFDDGNWRFRLCIALLGAATKEESYACGMIGVGPFEDMESIEMYDAILALEDPPKDNLREALNSMRTEFMSDEILAKHNFTLRKLT